MAYVNTVVTGSPANKVTPLILGLKAARHDNPDRQPCLGTWMQLPGANLGRMLASTGVKVRAYHFLLSDSNLGNSTNQSVKWVLVDMEHGAIGDTEVRILQAIQSCRFR